MLGHRADFQVEVVPDLSIRAYSNLIGHGLLEARQFRSQFVGTRRNAGKAIGAGFIGELSVDHASARVGQLHGDSWNQGLRGVLNSTADRPITGLRKDSIRRQTHA